MSTIKSQKLSKIEKLAVATVIFLFLIGLIIGIILLSLSVDVKHAAPLVGIGAVYGGIFGAILVGSYVSYILKKRHLKLA